VEAGPQGKLIPGGGWSPGEVGPQGMLIPGGGWSPGEVGPQGKLDISRLIVMSR